MVDGFVVPRDPKYFELQSNRAKYVAKAICSYGNCKPVKRSQEVEVELITGMVHRVLPRHKNPTHYLIPIQPMSPLHLTIHFFQIKTLSQKIAYSKRLQLPDNPNRSYDIQSILHFITLSLIYDIVKHNKPY